MEAAELPVNAIRRQIAGGVDIIVQLGRLRDKSRRVLEIVEVTGFDGHEVNINPIYRFRESGESKGAVIGQLEKVGELKGVEKLKAAGIN